MKTTMVPEEMQDTMRMTETETECLKLSGSAIHGLPVTSLLLTERGGVAWRRVDGV